MNILRLLHICTSGIILVFILVNLFRYGSNDETFLVLGLLIYLVLALYFVTQSHYNKEEDILSLWLKRKNLEQKKKIKELEKTQKNNGEI